MVLITQGATELFGVLRFLNGEKCFMVGSVNVTIPDDVNGIVRFGHIEFPYEQFVGGVCWVLSQGGRFSQEHQVPQAFAIEKPSQFLLWRVS